MGFIRPRTPIRPILPLGQRFEKLPPLPADHRRIGELFDSRAGVVGDPPAAAPRRGPSRAEVEGEILIVVAQNPVSPWRIFPASPTSFALPAARRRPSPPGRSAASFPAPLRLSRSSRDNGSETRGRVLVASRLRPIPAAVRTPLCSVPFIPSPGPCPLGRARC